MRALGDFPQNRRTASPLSPPPYSFCSPSPPFLAAFSPSQTQKQMGKSRALFEIILEWNIFKHFSPDLKFEETFMQQAYLDLKPRAHSDSLMSGQSLCAQRGGGCEPIRSSIQTRAFLPQKGFGHCSLSSPWYLWFCPRGIMRSKVGVFS